MSAFSVLQAARELHNGNPEQATYTSMGTLGGVIGAEAIGIALAGAGVSVLGVGLFAAAGAYVGTYAFRKSVV